MAPPREAHSTTKRGCPVNAFKACQVRRTRRADKTTAKRIDVFLPRAGQCLEREKTLKRLSSEGRPQPEQLDLCGDPSESTAAASSTQVLTASQQLQKVLMRHGAFPAKHRGSAWKVMTNLPRNEAAYEALSSPSTASLPSWMQESAPDMLTSTHGPRHLKLLAKLAAWSPALIEMRCVPQITAVLGEVFQDDEVLAFELSAAFFLNWGKAWLEGPWIAGMLDLPMVMLTQAWQVLEAMDQELLRYLEACAAHGLAENEALKETSSAKCTILWPLFKDLWRPCLTQETWLVLWDHIITLWHEPHMLAAAGVAILRCLRQTLLTMPVCSLHHILRVLRDAQVIPIPQLLAEFYAVRETALSAAPSVRKSPSHPLIPAGSKYPDLPAEAHPVLDYLVQDRARARAEFEASRHTLERSEEKYRVIETLLKAQSSMRDEHAELLRMEELRRNQAAEEDAQLEADRQRHLEKVLSIRVDRLHAAGLNAQLAMQQQRELHTAEHRRAADETLQRKLRAEAESERWALEIEIAGIEALATQQLSEIIRQHRIDDADRQLRQDMRAELLRKDQEDKIARNSQRVADEAERSKVRMEIERQLESHQWELADWRRQEVEMQLKLDDQVCHLQLGEVECQRSVRAAKREAEEQSNYRQEVVRRQLSEEARRRAEAQTAVIQQERRKQEHRLYLQQRSLAEARMRARESFERQAERIRLLDHEEGNAEFELRMKQTLKESESDVRKSELMLQRELAVVESIRTAGERGEALDIERRELLKHRGFLNEAARKAAVDLLQHDRRVYGAGLDADLTEEPPVSASTSEVDSVFNSEDRLADALGIRPPRPLSASPTSSAPSSGRQHVISTDSSDLRVRV